eukprot:TRINITY_DN3803_c0_g1_i1.p1 TRINITY_DN3803_c0_g1~~TRINITY_DN3803_c0_g1_i1.p1  ORF type:complete len:519 (-),score=155.75 TRINITY_DN3803_c0_g1_i1:122-1678(-)
MNTLVCRASKISNIYSCFYMHSAIITHNSGNNIVLLCKRYLHTSSNQHLQQSPPSFQSSIFCSASKELSIPCRSMSISASSSSTSTPSSSSSSSSSHSPVNPKSTKQQLAGLISNFVQKFRKHAFFLEDYLPVSSPVVVSPVSSYSKITPTNKMTWNQALNIVEPDMEQMNKNIISLLVGPVMNPTHPLLAKIASYYFELKGKRLRPAIVLLLSRAVSVSLDVTPPSSSTPPTSSSTLSSSPPSPTSTSSSTISTTTQQMTTGSVSPQQIQLAEIVEMIHTASLVHDDVIDEAVTRRDLPSANIKFGNKMSVMAGDFLLARASISLAQLQNCEVTELMATVLGELIEGEFMQTKGSSDFDYYLKKTYLKTASLLANACRCAAILGGASRSVVDMATEYGRNIGLAFQIVDDLLDFTGTSKELGKEALVDLSLGLATAPVLYARQEFPELDAMINRKFSQEGDVLLARTLVQKSKGIEKTRQLAEHYSQLAIQALAPLAPSLAHDALMSLPQALLSRSR